MSSNPLNLSALRTGRLPGARARERSNDPFVLSRREILGLAGTAALAASPTLQAIGDTLHGQMEVTGDSTGLRFTLGGVERWAIDPRRFGPRARLTVKRSERLIRFDLADARFPGTDIPAGMTCELHPVLSGWRMRLRMEFGGFACETPFERWLAGSAKAESQIRIGERVYELGKRASVRLAGPAHAEFTPAWSLRINGSGTAAVTYDGASFTAAESEIAIMGSGDASLLAKPPRNRTLVSFDRGIHTWTGWPGLEAVAASDCPFDSIRIEAGESGRGNRSCALVAESGDDVATGYRPFAGSAQQHADSIAIPLTRMRFSADLDGDSTACMADHPASLSWVHIKGCSLLLGGPAESRPFEVLRRGERVDRFRCRVPIAALSAPLEGALAHPAYIPGGGLVQFSLAETIPTLGRGIGHVRLDPGTGEMTAAFPLLLLMRIVRPEDLLSLVFRFENLTVNVDGTGPHLKVTDAAQPAYVIVYFPPQSIMEQAFFETAKGTNLSPNDPEKGREPKPGAEPPVAPVKAHMADWSRLAFVVPRGQRVEYTLASLLNWSQFQPSVVPAALPPPNLERALIALDEIDRLRTVRARVRASLPSSRVSKGIPQLAVVPVLREPADSETAIEAPCRLVLSPSELSAWKHATDAVTHNERTELWHTRLAVRDSSGAADEQDDYYRTLRAVWSPDYASAGDAGKPVDRALEPPHYGSPPAGPNPFRTTLDAKDRYEIVRASADFIHLRKNNKTYVPKPIDVNRFMLTSLGAWMDTRGAWDHAEGLSLEEWTHRSTMARDHYVRVVYAGYLVPFGHRASLIKVTERKIVQVDGRNNAVLMQRMFIVVREPEREYPSAGMKYQGREIPFQNVRILTLITPDLDPPPTLCLPGQGQDAFWPVVLGTPFHFHTAGTDRAGRHIEFSIPMFFVSTAITEAADQTVMRAARDKYNADPVKVNSWDPLRRSELHGAKVQLAVHPKVVAGANPGHPTGAGDTTVECMAMTFAIATPQGNIQPPFYPVMETAEVNVPALRQLAGVSKTPKIKLHDAYLNSGMDPVANKGQIFAAIASPEHAVPMNFGKKPDGSNHGDKTGGMATPNMSVTALSRTLGPVGGAPKDVANMASGLFDPKTFFDDTAQLIGGIALNQIIKGINNATNFGEGKSIPKLTTEHSDNKITTKLLWNPDVQPLPAPLDKLFQPKNPSTCLNINALLETTLGSPPTYTILGSLGPFDMELFGVIIIRFKLLAFHIEKGHSPDVSCQLKKKVPDGEEGVEFEGPLAFVNTLRDLIPSDGFKDPPFLDIGPDGIVAGFTIAIPTISVGIFSLQNISLGAAITIPFTGDPVLFTFNFCDPEHPFMLTVWIFGGGGYFNVTVSIHGLKELNASFQFGGNFCLDIGVASGGVHVMAGVTYSLIKDPSGDQTSLTAFFKLGGYVNILGIISISLELTLSLKYDGKKLTGRASLELKIEILFFTIPVSISYEKQLSGASGDPAFSQMIEPADWNEYCLAFA